MGRAISSPLNLAAVLFAGLVPLTGAPVDAVKSPDEGRTDRETVKETANRPPMPPLPGALSFLFRTGISSRAGLPSFGLLDAVVVTSTRAPLAADRVAASLRLLDADSLRKAPTVTLDGALRSIPGFSLFRRSDSLIANPTAQGVSMRGLGPSGASRSLVLLDGIPLNDPFGGWVSWSKLPREGLGRIEMVPGGGGTAWGNAALGGVLHLFTAPVRTSVNIVERPPQPPTWGNTGSFRFAGIAGDFGTRSFEFAMVVPAPTGTLQILARDFSTEGFHLVAADRRGPIDVPAWSRHRWVTARWRQPLGNKAELLATVRRFDEHRGNGTPFQRNDSSETFLSVAVAGEAAEYFTWNAVGHLQDQAYASTFGSVNAERTSESPAAEQFDVPSTAFGLAWTGVWTHESGGRTSFGADTRGVRGETREHYFFSGGAFRRLRIAGGRQFVAGGFLLHDRSLAEGLRVTFGFRLDSWREADGHRHESDRSTSVRSRDERYADRSGTSASPSAALLWVPARGWRLRASVQQSFRRPTLNELYRPFRVGPNITEANAELGTENVTGIEGGIEWRSAARTRAESGQRRAAGPPPPPVAGSRVQVGATVFSYELRDAVGNVTLVHGPGFYPLFGNVSAGGVGRQRLNVERIRVRGLELSAQWAPFREFAVTADYLLNDSTVRRSVAAPNLVGKRVGQVPRDSAAIGVRWAAPAAFMLAPRLRWIGRQFEDDENQLRLNETVVVDLRVSRNLTEHLELFVTIENVGNARIETGRNVGGLVNVGTPRLMLGGLRGSW